MLSRLTQTKPTFRYQPLRCACVNLCMKGAPNYAFLETTKDLSSLKPTTALSKFVWMRSAT